MTNDELRAFVLSFEGIEERQHQGRPDFRLKGKIVVNLDEDERVITIKLSLDDQAALMARNDSTFTLPGGWAKHGWTTISLASGDDDEIRELVTEVIDMMRL